MRWGFIMAAVLVAAGVLGGCGKPKLSPEAEAVRFTYASEQVSGCQSRGLVSASDPRAGLAANAARRAVEAKLRSQAHQQGGSVVLLKKLDSSYWSGVKGEGEAFSCLTAP
jgi:hypothetical protein